MAELRYSKATSRPARWVVAVPEDSPVQSAKDMDGMTVATELPITTERFFKDAGVNVNVEYSWGTTEVKAKGKLVEGIVDITETGSSLRANNLKIVGTVMESTTRFIANKAAWADPVKRCAALSSLSLSLSLSLLTWSGAGREKIESIALLLQAAIDGKDKIGLKANIPKSSMDECLALMPSETAPTVADLTDSEYVSAEIVRPSAPGSSFVARCGLRFIGGVLLRPACDHVTRVRFSLQVCTAVEGREITPKLYRLGARGILMYPLNVVVH